jgi:Zn-dependent peptidase ImmA (M78 family)
VHLTQVVARLHRYDWNERVLNAEDFERICQFEGVQIFHKASEEWDSAYFLDDGQPVIAINKTLRRGPRIAVAFHALAHHFQQEQTACYLKGRDHRSYLVEGGSECDAHIIAACAVLPRTVLNHHTRAEIVRDYDFCKELLDLRYAILWMCDL